MMEVVDEVVEGEVVEVGEDEAVDHDPSLPSSS